MPSPPNPRKRLFRPVLAGVGVATLVAVLVPSLPVRPLAKEVPSANLPKKSRLSATRYFTMAPFTLPLFDGGVVTEQFTIVIALELTDDSVRDEVQHLVPIVRDAMYRELYAMVTFRRKGAPLPGVDMLKLRLYRVARSIAGAKRVKSLLIQQAFKRPAR